jgi:hypothetical protein
MINRQASLVPRLGILNLFLIENLAHARHVRKAPASPTTPGVSLDGYHLFGGKMAMFSRSSVRKRVISLATTASVAATSLALAQAPTKIQHVHGTMPVQYVSDRQQASGEAPFLAENDAAMSKMMADMTVTPTGDVDRDFVAMMVPHHQGAVDMAKAELRYGSNEVLRRLAQEIIVTQQQEIAVMRQAVGLPLPPSVPSPTQVHSMHMEH